jgi:two-component system, chemotaxis family, protein-glutamate methylesterase/glutaminase
MIKVIVTDDSAFMRKILTDIINSDSELEVVAVARDGKNLLDIIPKYNPDVITLDISMPVLDGISALKEIMQRCPIPVVMISALSDDDHVFNCLEIGAVDFISKTSGIISIDMGKKKDVIIEKIKVASKAKIFPKTKLKRIKYKKILVDESDRIIVIGASTGGPKTIEFIVKALPKDFPIPILIVQHMPYEFIKTFSKRLDKICDITIKEAEDNEIIKKGIVYIAPGGTHMGIKIKDSDKIISLSKDPPELGVRPSINFTMRSVAKIYGENSVGFILTGMGSDGSLGLKYIHDVNGKTYVQDEESCVIPSMPRSAIEMGVVDKIISLNSISDEIINIAGE